ncbi:MAG: hypothetical protein F4W68_04210 [Cenarchaeum sp. SB0661_bin_35]|nr:hypothetical protein [Cenarchaeum sp. SB0666_bin_15]MYB46483.1 hypothetical protein [Cenarchaeum sp. SB0662_bin_33]MYC79685.1 hypothetical protein [Cenarchaeum sp. SB0661_bin_35]MYD58348.1 hypothetical protein [Cenarchaeum sp. SB0678_bin_8]
MSIVSALEESYNNAPMTSFHDYRAKVTGYSPAPNRYFVRRTAPTGQVPKEPSWNEQKVNVTGYTQPSNQYFATRARLAYHPPDKTFGGYSLGASSSKPKAKPKPEKPAEQPKPQAAPPETKSRQSKLEQYEAEYIKRVEGQQKAKEAPPPPPPPTTKSAGLLPKGFEPPPVEKKEVPPKKKVGLLPKGF